jgi:hypothetical protein
MNPHSSICLAYGVLSWEHFRGVRPSSPFLPMLELNRVAHERKNICHPECRFPGLEWHDVGNATTLPGVSMIPLSQ